MTLTILGRTVDAGYCTRVCAIRIGLPGVFPLDAQVLRIYVAGGCPRRKSTAGEQIHPFWDVFQGAVESWTAETELLDITAVESLGIEKITSNLSGTENAAGEPWLYWLNLLFRGDFATGEFEAAVPNPGAPAGDPGMVSVVGSAPWNRDWRKRFKKYQGVTKGDRSGNDGSLFARQCRLGNLVDAGH